MTTESFNLQFKDTWSGKYIMINSIDGSIDKLTLSRLTLLQCFYHLILSQPYPRKTLNKLDKYQFSSERLIMKPLQYRDKQFYIELFTSKKVTKYTGGVLPQKQAQQNFVNSLKAITVEPIQYFTWLVSTKNDEQNVGIITLLWRDQQKQLAEFGVMFTPKQHNQGYCCESTRAFISYCFDTLKLPSLYSFTLNNNVTSQHILKKLGFNKVQNVPFKQLVKDGLYWEKTNNKSNIMTND